MEQSKRRTKSAALLAGFEVMGDVLLLQILFLVTSLPLVTLLPAAVAFQRAFRLTVLEDRPGVARSFFDQFRWAWRRIGVAGILVPLGLGAAVFSILFWLSTPGTLGTFALCVLVPLCGAAVGGYVAFLGASMDADPDVSRRALLDRTVKLALNKPLALAGIVIVLATWGLLALRLPTLIPIGSGLVPALLVWLLVRKDLADADHISG